MLPGQLWAQSRILPHHPAKEDLKKIYDYIAGDSKYYAIKVSQEFIEKVVFEKERLILRVDGKQYIGAWFLDFFQRQGIFFAV